MSDNDQATAIIEAGGDVVEVYSAGDSIDAHAAASMLREADIDVQIVGEGLTLAKGAIPFGESTAPGLWVKRADAGRATELLSQWESEVQQRTSKPTLGPYPPGMKPILLTSLVLLFVSSIVHIVTRGELSAFLAICTWCFLGVYVLFVAYYHKKFRIVSGDGEDES